MAVNIGPFRVIETTDCDALISRDFASAMAESDSVRVQGMSFLCITGEMLRELMPMRMTQGSK